jgi:hypothetical protein
MQKTFSKTFLSVLSRMGMKFVNAFMLASILFTNFTGGVQARAESRNDYKSAEQKHPYVIDDAYIPPSFTHPEPRNGEARERSELALDSQERTQQYSVQTSGFELPVSYLSDLNPISATVGWDSLRLDSTTDGWPIVLDGISYPKGLGAHAYSNVVYDLDQKYSSFESNIGISDQISGFP